MNSGVVFGIVFLTAFAVGMVTERPFVGLLVGILLTVVLTLVGHHA